MNDIFTKVFVIVGMTLRGIVEIGFPILLWRAYPYHPVTMVFLTIYVIWYIISLLFAFHIKK